MASWKYFECAKSKGEILKADFDTYLISYDKDFYHNILIKGAKYLLQTDLSKYGIKKLVMNNNLNDSFVPRVYDPDNYNSINYCELVLKDNL